MRNLAYFFTLVAYDALWFPKEQYIGNLKLLPEATMIDLRFD